MFDFLAYGTDRKKEVVTVYPKFLIFKNGHTKCSDLMIRGGDFYAAWIEDEKRWSTDEMEVFYYIDKMTKVKAEEIRKKYPDPEVKVIPLYLQYADSGLIDKWHKFCQKQMRDNYHILDENIIFSNQEITKEDYASRKLSYPLRKGSHKNWDRLMKTLYSKEELHKLEWAIGAIVTGDSKSLQKFVVLYGAAGTGKSTFIDIVQSMFDGYCTAFDAKALGNSNNQFALEPFKSNPLVAIQHDGDLSRIEDNTRLNSVVSHEEMTVNEKFKGLYSTRFKAFLIMGSNSPVKITDSKSGLLRRLIDVTPTGKTVSHRTYRKLISGIMFELGAIAYKCKEIYLKDPDFYDDYVPIAMLSTTNDFYDYILENSFVFEEQGYTTLKQAWELYKNYCEDANVPYPYKRIHFKQELMNYFEEFNDRAVIDGKSVRNLYSGFIINKFKTVTDESIDVKNYILVLDKNESLLDDVLKNYPAQYANDTGTPTSKWTRVRRKLKDIDTSKIHYVKVPENHIVIDFDIPDPETGEKSYILNLEAASKFPPTYAELSKSGAGIHLHYIYDGDVTQLESHYAKHIEVKVFKGDMALRRRLTKCNDVPIATISSGLPIKKGVERKLVNFDGIKDERMLRNMVRKNLAKEYHDNTKPSMDFIKKLTDDAYNGGISYDISDMKTQVVGFALSSTHQADYCLGLVNDIHWASEDKIEAKKTEKEPHIIILDIEVAKNVLLICWKELGEDKPIISMWNPAPEDIEKLFEYDIVGHNVRRYDNHILYARWLGYTNEQLYSLSQRIIVEKDKNAFFPSAYSLHYADTLDYPVKKMGLKKWEIELDMPHDEFEFDWDKPIPEEFFPRLEEYCHNDVRATEAVWLKTQADFKARKMLAAISGGKINSTTNALSTLFIFGNDKHPQSQFNYRNMGDVSKIESRIYEIFDATGRKWSVNPDYTCFDALSRPIFPGYKFENGKSWYRDEDPKEGGYVYSEPGIHLLLALLDIASMHPSSVLAEMLFGKDHTPRFEEIVKARLAIKHKDFETVRKMFNGALAPYVEDESQAKALADALKIVINSVYGLTSAKFANAFKDPRNKDNIVAKRGALFMINLKHEIQDKGFKAAHIKTDSIKIPDATPEIINFVMAYGKLYGYTFEHEATYERMCLVDKANYVCRYADADWCQEHYNYIPEKNIEHSLEWDVTGAKFCKPNYIFKELFTDDAATLKDLSIVGSANKNYLTMYMDVNENLPDVTAEEKELKKIEKQYKDGTLSDTTFESESERLRKAIAEGHNYIYIGKIGSFVPILEGCNGANIVNYNSNTCRYGAVTGTKGYRWLETEYVAENHLEDRIDMGYYDERIEDLKEEVALHCTYGSQAPDLERFIDISPYPDPVYDTNGVPVYEDKVPWN